MIRSSTAYDARIGSRGCNGLMAPERDTRAKRSGVPLPMVPDLAPSAKRLCEYHQSQNKRGAPDKFFLFALRQEL